MEKINLSDGEWKLMNLLWGRQPLTIGEMVSALKGDTDWSKATVNMMLLRLEEKGAVKAETGGRRKIFYPLLDRENAVIQEAENTLKKIKTGGIGLLISTMAKQSELTEEEIDELYLMLKKGAVKQ
ncbi:MAG: BlaI/MecI/CopY family transcriptional regulator [Clostridia bacterium]|nr:BlaI/MecI/CopY family transcriptional regulator [Clostridia bacterium]